MSLIKRKRLPLAGVGVVAIVAAGYLVFWWREDHGHHPAYGDVGTWATFLVAVVGIPFALYQLRLQRRQLAEQQKTISEEFARQKKRDELLDEQLGQAKAAGRAMIRAQAEQVDLKFDKWAQRSGGSGPGDPYTIEHFHMARVTNNSPRPIRDVQCRFKKNPSALSDPAIRVGKYEQVRAQGMSGIPAEPGETVAVMRAGDECGFVFDAKVSDAPNARMYVRFTDDAGTQWHINHDLHLQQDSDYGAFS